MDFPEIARWVFAGLALMAAAGLGRGLWRLRRADPADRPACRWDAADQCAGLVTAGGGAFGSPYLFGTGLALTAVVMGAKAGRAALAHRRRRVERERV
ncbi:hypothetical protein [Streptomyces sp. NRRL F-2664]|uniref:hypothetical protein n=1 Tax=Streptomyces sp. NRRL F-2664 TaxID=1463842 RepID=UPI0004C6FB7E|nr:hypothetical protein [Streptomyces sp. NRRL F-2664]